jgi:hypothetical protein
LAGGGRGGGGHGDPGRRRAGGVQVVESIVVKLHADTPPTAMPLPRRWEPLFSVTGSTREGALQIVLQQPLTLAAARAAVNRARLLPQVVYANVAVANVSAAREGADVAANVGRDALASHPPVARLIVKYRDAARTNAAISNEQLPAAAAGELASLAGQPIVHERAMSGGAYVVRLFRALPAAEAISLARSLEANPEIEYAEPGPPQATRARAERPPVREPVALQEPCGMNRAASTFPRRGTSRPAARAWSRR